MVKYEWSRAHAVDIPDLDREHQRLFEICEQLRQALATPVPLADLQSVLQELAVRTGEHFRHEEREMRAARYPQYTWHHEQHLAARKKLRMLARRVNDGDRQASAELLAGIAAWLEGHIGIADRMLGAHLRNRQRLHLVAGDRASR